MAVDESRQNELLRLLWAETYQGEEGMIIKSRVTGSWVLEVLENFRTDRSLPKYAVAAKPKPSNNNNDISSKFAGNDPING